MPACMELLENTTRRGGLKWDCYVPVAAILVAERRGNL